jgi:hypothetical protein
MGVRCSAGTEAVGVALRGPTTLPLRARVLLIATSLCSMRVPASSWFIVGTSSSPGTTTDPSRAASICRCIRDRKV